MRGLSWVAILRLGLVQTALGGVAAFAIHSLNRVMLVEYGLPALVPAALVAFQYLIQLSRPHVGFGSDRGGRRTPWILAGVALLAAGAVLAAYAAARLGDARALGLGLGVAAYAMIGAGMGAAGTSLLALIASRVSPERRAAAASATWILMIVGMAATAGGVSQALKPFSPERLIVVAAGVGAGALVLSVLAVWGIERGAGAQPHSARSANPHAFRDAVSAIWADPKARLFTAFVFVSMLTYSAQELLLQPFSGLVFHLAPGQSAGIDGVMHGGVLLGMLGVGLAGRLIGREERTLRRWTVIGCTGSGLAILLMAAAARVGPGWPLQPTVFVLGLMNGVFAVAAIASMMALAGAGAPGTAGVRMGIWGAAQALGFAFGDLSGAGALDLGRSALAPGAAFAAVFSCQAVLFLGAAWLASRVGRGATEAYGEPALIGSKA